MAEATPKKHNVTRRLHSAERTTALIGGYWQEGSINPSGRYGRKGYPQSGFPRGSGDEVVKGSGASDIARIALVEAVTDGSMHAHDDGSTAPGGE